MLKAAGQAVFLPRELRRELSVAALAGGVYSSNPEAHAAIREAFWDAAGDAAGAVLSDENILGSAHGPALRRTGKFYPDGHTRLHRVFTGLDLGEATVFLAIREPSGFLVSAYSQRISARGYTPFKKFLGPLDPCTLFWSELVERVRQVPGVAEVVVWRYEDYPRVARQVLRRMLPPDVAASIVLPGRRANPGLSTAAHAMMADLANQGEDVDSVRVRALRDAFPKGPDMPGLKAFPDELLIESARYYSEDLDDIAGLPDVTLLHV